MSERQGADPRIAAELAALVLHDFRNMLAVADTSAHLCEQNLDDRPFAERQIKRAREQLRRAQDLATRCLAVAKGEPIDRARIRFGDLVDEAVSSVAARAGVEIGAPPDQRNVEIACDKALFARVLANLVENARDALEGGGHIELSIEPLPDGGHAVRVRDDGPGLPAHLWLAGVTTKEAGSGLGLLVSRAVMSAHGGAMRLEPRDVAASSRPGTTISLILPA